MKPLPAIAVLFLWAGSVAALEPEECAQRIDQDASLGSATPRWQFPAVAPNVMEGMTRWGKNPLVTTGDFDSDGTTDVAFLIKTAPDKKRIAVCLSGQRSRVQYIDGLYCDDGIDTTRRGSEYHDFETDKAGRYSSDGIAAFCYEKAGATYLWERGAFRRIVDSD